MGPFFALHALVCMFYFVVLHYLFGFLGSVVGGVFLIVMLGRGLARLVGYVVVSVMMPSLGIWCCPSSLVRCSHSRTPI